MRVKKEVEEQLENEGGLPPENYISNLLTRPRIVAHFRLDKSKLKNSLSTNVSKMPVR